MPFKGKVMPLKTFVKIGNVSNLSDARYCAGMGVDVIGFNINPQSENYINPETYREITGWIAGVYYAGEFDGKTFPIESNYNLDFIQVSYPENIDKARAVCENIILKIIISDLKQLADFEQLMKYLSGQVRYFLLEKADDHLTKPLKNEIKRLGKEYPIILGSGITPENVNELISSLNIIGIELKGGQEDVPGTKDYDDLANILEILEKDE